MSETKDKTSAEIQTELDAMAEARKELNRELRRAKAREEAEAQRLKREADRNEADALLEAFRLFGVPDGMSLEVANEISKLIVNENTPVFSHIVELLKEDNSDEKSEETSEEKSDEYSSNEQPEINDTESYFEHEDSDNQY